MLCDHTGESRRILDSVQVGLVESFFDSYLLIQGNSQGQMYESRDKQSDQGDKPGYIILEPFQSQSQVIPEPDTIRGQSRSKVRV